MPHTFPEQWTELFERLRHLPPLETDAASLIGAAEPDALPPHVTWALVELARQYRQTTWALEVLCKRVLPRLRRRRSGHDGGRDLPLEGIVPGLPDWRYRVNRNWEDEDSADDAAGFAVLTHRGTREFVHVELHAGPEAFHDWTFGIAALSGRETDAAQRRLRELFPRREDLQTAHDVLERHNVVRLPDDRLSCMGAPLLEQVEALLGFAWSWNGAQDRLALAAAIGDWLAVRDQLEARRDADLLALVAPLADDCTRRWAALSAMPAE